MQLKVAGALLIGIGMLLLLQTFAALTQPLALSTTPEDVSSTDDGRVTLNLDVGLKIHIGDHMQVATETATLTWQSEDSAVHETTLHKGDMLEVYGGYKNLVRVYAPAYKREGVMEVAALTLTAPAHNSP